MSNDNRETLAIPIELIKAETLRSIAKDVGLPPTGKKEELLERMREGAAAGWVVIPQKRKSPVLVSETNRREYKRASKPELTTARNTRSSGRKTRSATASSRNRSALEKLSNSRRASTASTSRRALSKVSKQDPKNSEPDEPVVDGTTDAAVHDEVSFPEGGTTNAYITSDDILALTGEIPALSHLTLWRPTGAFASRDSPSVQRVEYWLIPAHEDEKVQGVTVFKELYSELLEDEKGKREKRGRNKEVGDDEEETFWYQVLVSRRVEEGAIGVKLVKGTIEGSSVVPVKDSEEEDGIFWISQLQAAKKTDKHELDHISVGLA